MNTLNHQPSEVVVIQGEIQHRTILGIMHYFNDSRCKTQIIFHPAPAFPGITHLSAFEQLIMLTMNEMAALQLTRSIATLVDMHSSKEADLEVDKIPHPQFCNVHRVRIARNAWRRVIPLSIKAGNRGQIPGAKVKKAL
jgi:hypothetical protein